MRDGENCLLVPPGDAAALGAAIGRVRNDHELARRLGRAAQETARAHFGLDKIGAGTVALARLGLDLWARTKRWQCRNAKAGTGMSEIAFDKYQTKGAYHWTEVFGPVYRLNAYTMARYELIIRALLGVQIGKGDRVLDVGCGDAALGGLVVMRTQAAIEGIDTSPLSIEIAQREFARHRLDGRFAVIDGYTYSYDDGQFRAVICSDVIEHVQKPDSLLLEMWRVLAPGRYARDDDARALHRSAARPHARAGMVSE